MLLEGKVAVVTGGTRGIGLAIVKSFLHHGASVTLCGSRRETVEKALAEIEGFMPGAPVRGAHPDLTDEAEAMMGLRVRRWSIRKMKTRWGSCRPETASVTINLDLATHDIACLRNIIIHELCHIKARDHGPAFQALMDHYSPDWRELDRQLKTEGVRLS